MFQKPEYKSAYAACAIAAVLVLISFVFLSGCIRQASPPDFVKIVGTYTTSEGTFMNPAPCISFLCENQSGFFVSFRQFFGYKPSLYKGKCYFNEYDPTSDAAMADLRNVLELKKKERMKSFMIGQGPNLAAADEAKRFCKGNLGFAIHWLKGDTSVDTKVIENNIECTLKNEIIPIFIYNMPGDKGEYVKNISKSLADNGPSIVAVGTSLSGAGAINDINFELGTIKAYCPDCLRAVHVKFGDISVLAAANQPIVETGPGIITTPLQPGETPQIPVSQGAPPKPADSIDVVLYDVDLNKFNCDKNIIAIEVQNFSSAILTNYGKPSLAMLKSKISGKCTEDAISRVYEYMYSNIPLFVPNGLIGMANDDLSMMFDSGKQNNPIFNSWFKNCIFYYDQSDMYNSPQVPILIPKGGDTAISGCSFLNTMSMLLAARCNQNYSNLPGIEPFDSNASCGDSSCANEGVLEEAGNIGAQLSADQTKILDGFEKYCEQWNTQIRQLSAQFNFDPSVARAVAWYNTNFDPASTNEPFFEAEECNSCNAYSGEDKNICCGIEELGRLKSYAESSLATGGKGKSREYMIYYFSVYGHKHGMAAMQISIMAFRNAVDKGTEFTFDSSVLEILSRASKLRIACGTCRGTSQSLLLSSEIQSPPADWQQSTSLNLVEPITKSVCIDKIGNNQGVYWLSGIKLISSLSDGNVTAARAGTVREIGDGARRFRYIITESNGATIIYSNLLSVDKKLRVGSIVAAGDQIGIYGEYLRFEVCTSDYQQCTDTSKGLARPFRDPSVELGLQCLSIGTPMICQWTRPPTPGKCQITSHPLYNSDCSSNNGACGGAFCAIRAPECSFYAGTDTQPHMHAGVDMVPKTGDLHVYAAQSGTIVTVKNSDTAPPMVIEIKGDDGCVTRYLHVNAYKETVVGMHVTAGQQIAYITGEGNSDHLHFEVCESNDPSLCGPPTPEANRPLVNPADFPGVCAYYH